MKSYCSHCDKETNYKVLEKFLDSYNDEDTGIWGKDTYEIIKCLGCDSISFRIESTCSEDFDPNSGEMYTTIKLYPEVSKDTLCIKNIEEIPNKIRKIYEETIKSYNNGNVMLCAAGLRTIIEGICADKGVLDGSVIDTMTGRTSRKKNLQAKINGLHEKSFLTSQHADILHQHRFLGNEAVHELDAPSREELRLAIEIIEHTLQNIYELESKAEDLKWQRERRIKRK